MKKRIGIVLSISAIFILSLATTDQVTAADPYKMPNNAWISLSGKVETVAADSFTMTYGKDKKTVTVEMDDGDRDADAYKLLKGDKVTVTGVVDDDLFETTTIEASSVYVENIGTTFYSSAVDEEDFITYWTPVVVSRTVVQGTVTEVNEDEFTIRTGKHALRVEVDQMPYNPLDDKGYQKVEVGDRVSVTGKMDSDFFEGRELEASHLVVLSG